MGPHVLASGLKEALGASVTSDQRHCVQRKDREVVTSRSFLERQEIMRALGGPFSEKHAGHVNERHELIDQTLHRSCLTLSSHASLLNIEVINLCTSRDPSLPTTQVLRPTL